VTHSKLSPCSSSVASRVLSYPKFSSHLYTPYIPLLLAILRGRNSLFHRLPPSDESWNFYTSAQLTKFELHQVQTISSALLSPWLTFDRFPHICLFQYCHVRHPWFSFLEWFPVVCAGQRIFHTGLGQSVPKDLWFLLAFEKGRARCWYSIHSSFSTSLLSSMPAVKFAILLPRDPAFSTLRQRRERSKFWKMKSIVEPNLFWYFVPGTKRW
jgi:hypothetical protein